MLAREAPIRSIPILGGDLLGKQRKRLAEIYDIIVATPGRLLEHKLQSTRPGTRIP